MAAPDLADRAAPAKLSAPERPVKGFFDYQRFQVTLPAGPQTRDVVRAGKVVALLPLDLERGEVVMIRQFRPAAHLANGKGELIEIVAGRVEPGEQLAESRAARVSGRNRRHAIGAGRAVQLSADAGIDRRGGDVFRRRRRCLARAGADAADPGRIY